MKYKHLMLDIETMGSKNNSAIVAVCAVEFNLDEALKGLSFFIDDNEYQVWGNSARFDCGILVNAYEKLELGVPWKHFNERDVRTLVAFKPSVKKNMWFSGTPHYAPDDCKHQIKYCHEIFKTLTSF